MNAASTPYDLVRAEPELRESALASAPRPRSVLVGSVPLRLASHRLAGSRARFHVVARLASGVGVAGDAGGARVMGVGVAADKCQWAVLPWERDQSGRDIAGAERMRGYAVCPGHPATAKWARAEGVRAGYQVRAG
jgi:hypothetical protein